MLANLSTFLSDNCANVDLQMLIAGDPVAADIVRLNHRAVSAREEEIFTEIVEKWNLNPSQMSALYGTLRQQFSLIQGPPGTGKTNTAAAVVEVHHMAGQDVAVTAPSNNAVDEVSVRLVQRGVALARVGAWTRIAKKHLSVLQPHSLDFMFERELQGYSDGGRAWKRERSKISVRELTQESVVVAGTLEGVGIGPTLTSKPRVCGPVRAICGCTAFSFPGGCTMESAFRVSSHGHGPALIRAPSVQLFL